MREEDTSTMVRRLRGALGLTQENLARELGVTLSTVYRWEKGRSRPSGLALKALERLGHKTRRRAEPAAREIER